MKNILVTGAAGFIGSCVANQMILDGYNVYTIDNLSTGYKENLHKNITFIKGDIQDYKILSSLSKIKFYCIIHIAGQSSGEISFSDPVYDLQTNTQSTLHLLKFSIENDCKKFIYASTMSVYGNQPDTPISEKFIAVPESFYAVGKLASESYMKIFSNYGIYCTSLRLFNVYGPGQNMLNLKQGMISIYLSQALKNRKIKVKGSKDRYRDMVYIDDVVDAFKTCLINKTKKFDIYNVCTGVKTKVEDVISLIKLNLPYEIDVIYDGSTPGDLFGIYGSYNKFSKDLGWKPKIFLEEGLIKMINYYK